MNLLIGVIRIKAAGRRKTLSTSRKGSTKKKKSRKGKATSAKPSWMKECHTTNPKLIQTDNSATQFKTGLLNTPLPAQQKRWEY